MTLPASYLHRDHLGSVRAITNAAEAVVERAVYRPYGEQTEALMSPTVPEAQGWIGERYDADAGLQYLNARYYDPVLGLFLQPDWFEVLQPGVETNRYGYAGGDPVNGRDPGGNYAEDDASAAEIPPASDAGSDDGANESAASDSGDSGDSVSTDDASPAEFETAQTRPGGRAGVPTSASGQLRQVQATRLQREIEELHREVYGRSHPGWISVPVGGPAPSNSALRSLVQQRDSLAAVRGAGAGNTTTDPLTGAGIGRIILDSRGNSMLEPLGVTCPPEVPSV